MSDVDRLREEWNAAYAAFIGAFDTPLARRRDDNEFARDARQRLSDFNDAIQRVLDTPRPYAVPKAMADFVSNLAEPMSEPLNSAVFYQNEDDRRHFMGESRRTARSLLTSMPKQGDTQ